MNKCSTYNKRIATDNRASYIGGIVVKETKEQECTIMTNEEYRERLNEIFEKMDSRKLRFWYRYISKIEEG